MVDQCVSLQSGRTGNPDTNRRKDSTTSRADEGGEGSRSLPMCTSTKRGSRTSTFDTQADQRRRTGSRTTVKLNQSPDAKIDSSSDSISGSEPIGRVPHRPVVDCRAADHLELGASQAVTRRRACKFPERREDAGARRLRHRDVDEAKVVKDDPVQPHMLGNIEGSHCCHRSDVSGGRAKASQGSAQGGAEPGRGGRSSQAAASRRPDREPRAPQMHRLSGYLFDRNAGCPQATTNRSAGW